MALTGKTQVPNINSYYDRVLLERAVPQFLYNLFGQQRNIPKNNSDVIKFRKYGSLSPATTPLTEGTTPSGSQLSVTDIQAQVGYYGDFITFSDKLKMETEDPIETETTEILADQAAETLDTLARDVLSAGTNVQYASTATARNQITSSMTFDVAEAREAVRTLKNANAKKITSAVKATTGVGTVPVDKCYVAIVHPNTTYDLKQDSNFKGIETYRNGLRGAELPGEVGKIDEIRVIESTNAKVFAGEGAGGDDVYASIVFGMNAYGVTSISGASLKNIRKQLGSAGTADPLDQRATIGWKATFVAKILNDNFMVRIEHGVSA